MISSIESFGYKSIPAKWKYYLNWRKFENPVGAFHVAAALSCKSAYRVEIRFMWNVRYINRKSACYTTICCFVKFSLLSQAIWAAFKLLKSFGSVLSHKIFIIFLRRLILSFFLIYFFSIYVKPKEFSFSCSMSTNICVLYLIFL